MWKLNGVGMRYIIIVITDLLMLAFGVIGLGAILIASVIMVREGFNYIQILLIICGILFLAISFWINDLQV